jgi:hypothetical protein
VIEVNSVHRVTNVLIPIARMNFTSLIPDVKLYILKIIHPVDRFNLVLSGVLPGFQAPIGSIDTTQRYAMDYVRL